LSLLQKIHNGSFNLIGYNLNDTYCKALSDAFKSKNFLEDVDTVILDDNNLTSGGITMILEGLTCLKRLKKFVYKNNKMDDPKPPHIPPTSPNGALTKMMLRMEPFHLEELRINNCYMDSTMLEQLLDTVQNDVCQIRKLGLVNVGMIK